MFISVTTTTEPHNHQHFLSWPDFKGRWWCWRRRATGREATARVFIHYCSPARHYLCLQWVKPHLSHITAQQAHFPQRLHLMPLCAVYKSCIGLMKGKWPTRQRSSMSVVGILWIILCCETLKSFITNTWWIGVLALTVDESGGFVLAQLSAAHPALTIVNEFSLTKGGCPAAWPHRAPPRSTGPWTRHSNPPFSIFQCGREPAGFIGVFKSYSLKHSSTVSTRSRQFPFSSLPHFIFISCSPPSLCTVDSLSLSETSPFPPALPLFP